jgi:hypothetical protein
MAWPTQIGLENTKIMYQFTKIVKLEGIWNPSGNGDAGEWISSGNGFKLNGFSS